MEEEDYQGKKKKGKVGIEEGRLLFVHPLALVDLLVLSYVLCILFSGTVTIYDP